jgi:hypothetical protein
VPQGGKDSSHHPAFSTGSKILRKPVSATSDPSQSSGASSKPNPLAEIADLGATLELDDQDPDHLTIKISLADVVLTDEILAQLSPSPDLRSLNLKDQKVTGKGLL